jgi:hypothetical protein
MVWIFSIVSVWLKKHCVSEGGSASFIGKSVKPLSGPLDGNYLCFGLLGVLTRCKCRKSTMRDKDRNQLLKITFFCLLVKFLTFHCLVFRVVVFTCTSFWPEVPQFLWDFRCVSFNGIGVGSVDNLMGWILLLLYHALIFHYLIVVFLVIDCLSFTTLFFGNGRLVLSPDPTPTPCIVLDLSEVPSSLWGRPILQFRKVSFTSCFGPGGGGGCRKIY